VGERIVRGRLIVLPLLVGIIIPASGALAAEPHKPTAGSGGIEIRLVDVPADSQDALARSYIVDRLAPGTTIRRRVEITNGTGSTADVGIYPAAATLRRGKFGFAGGHSRNELASWTSVSQDVLRMPPGTKAFEMVTINVPEQASSGERYAVIWAEVSARAPATGGVTLVTRVGVRIYLSVGPGGAPASNFAIGALSAERSATGQPLVVAKVHNSGRRTLDISGELTLSKGPGGLRAGPFPINLGTALAPDNSRLVTVRLDKRLPRGPWHAQIRLRSGFLQRGAAATITFPRQAGAANVAPARPRNLIDVVILLALLAIAAFALLLYRRIRRRGAPLNPLAGAQ
jgi:hypothetical protein